jgi:hypothetical protein
MQDHKLLKDDVVREWARVGVAGGCTWQSQVGARGRRGWAHGYMGSTGVVCVG